MQPESAQGKVSNVRSVPADTFNKVGITALEQWQYQATGQEHKDMLVQLDYALDQPESSMEKVEVTPAAKHELRRQHSQNSKGATGSFAVWIESANAGGMPERSSD